MKPLALSGVEQLWPQGQWEAASNERHANSALRQPNLTVNSLLVTSLSANNTV